MKHSTILMILLFAFPPAAALRAGGLNPPAPCAGKRVVTKEVKHRRMKVQFLHRDDMKAGHPTRRCALAKVPATTLPVDCSGDATVQCPMLGNDQYGDCGPVMCCHADQIFTFGQGKAGWTQSTFDQTAVVKQYLQIAGGDNGTDESMLVGSGGIWVTGLAGNTQAIVLDSLDVDPANVPLTQFLIDQFYTVQMAWSVPDAFLNDFQTGASFLAAMTPDPNNGHYTPITDIDANGNYRLYTWGGWCWVSNAFIQSVQPQYFVVFSTRQFNPKTGYDSHGRHITAQAALWQQAGGKTIPASVVSAFPPPGEPPTPPAPPVPPAGSITITLTSAQVQAVITQAGAVALTADQVKALQTLQGIVLPGAKPAPKKTSNLRVLPTRPHDDRVAELESNLRRLTTIVEQLQEGSAGKRRDDKNAAGPMVP